MRRVYDDTALETVARDLEETFSCRIHSPYVSEYDGGMYRAKVSKIKEALVSLCDSGVKLGYVSHAHGIGNNNAIEIIYTENPNEEQICGLLHLTDDMYGGVIFWVSDIDGNKKTSTWIIRGCDDRNKYDMPNYFAKPYHD